MKYYNEDTYTLQEEMLAHHNKINELINMVNELLNKQKILEDEIKELKSLLCPLGYNGGN